MNFSEISFLKYPYRLQYLFDLFTLCTQNSSAFSSPTFIISSSVTHKQKKSAFKKCLPYFIIIATFTQPAAISRKFLQVTASKALGFFSLTHTVLPNFFHSAFGIPHGSWWVSHHRNQVLKEIFAGNGIFMGGGGVAAEKKNGASLQHFFLLFNTCTGFYKLTITAHIFYKMFFSLFFG